MDVEVGVAVVSARDNPAFRHADTGLRKFLVSMIYSAVMASELLLDLTGRLRIFRLPYSRGLVPIFEAIVNSLAIRGEP